MNFLEGDFKGAGPERRALQCGRRRGRAGSAVEAGGGLRGGRRGTGWGPSQDEPQEQEADPRGQAECAPGAEGLAGLDPAQLLRELLAEPGGRGGERAGIAGRARGSQRPRISPPGTVRPRRTPGSRGREGLPPPLPGLPPSHGFGALTEKACGSLILLDGRTRGDLAVKGPEWEMRSRPWCGGSGCVVPARAQVLPPPHPTPTPVEARTKSWLLRCGTASWPWGHL